VDVTLSERELRSRIRDQGVGVFASIARYHKLDDEDRAIGELLKGKATSLPERHGGSLPGWMGFARSFWTFRG
jgi:hypothetical protein